MKNIQFLIATLLFMFTTSCSNSQSFKSVDVTTFEKELKNTSNAQLLDVRTPGEFNSGHIENAKNVDWNGNNFDQEVANLDKDKPVYVYCLSGGRSKKAAKHLNELGFKNILELDGGFMAWDNAHPKSNEAWIGMTAEEYKSITTKDKVVVIDFYAEWCPPCKKMAPYLIKMEKEFAGKVSIYRIDAEKNKSLFKSLEYPGLPVVLVFKDGKITFEKNEFVSEEELRKAIN